MSLEKILAFVVVRGKESTITVELSLPCHATVFVESACMVDLEEMQITDVNDPRVKSSDLAPHYSAGWNACLVALSKKIKENT